MIWFFMCFRDKLVGFYKEFDIVVIKMLSLCCYLLFSIKKCVCNELMNLVFCVIDLERKYFIEFVEKFILS